MNPFLRLLLRGPFPVLSSARRVMPENGPESSLPQMLTVVQAAAIMGIGRTLAYQLVRTDSWPTPVVRAGRLIRIPSGPLMALVSTGSMSGDPHAA